MTFETTFFSRSSAWTLGLVGLLAALAGLPGRAHAQSTAELQPYTPYASPIADAAAAYPVADSVGAPPVVHVAPTLPAVSRSWYGYQLMATDAASIGLLFAGRAAPLGGITFFGAPPTIHALHGNVRMAIASPAMRVGLPLVGMVLGSSLEHCDRNASGEWETCGFGGAIAGAGIGLVAAMVLDYALAWQVKPLAPVDIADAVAPTRVAARVRVSSAGLAPLAGGAALVLGGSF